MDLISVLGLQGRSRRNALRASHVLRAHRVERREADAAVRAAAAHARSAR
jgi:hypothetical protein